MSDIQSTADQLADVLTAGMATKDQVGTTVWAVVDTQPPILLCRRCGSLARCPHSEEWDLVDIPAVLPGYLHSIEQDAERTEVVYHVQFTGPLPVTKAFISERYAKLWLKLTFGAELQRLADWALMQ